MRIIPPTVLTLWTQDAYGGRITSAADVASTALDTEDLNPQTGPFWIEGAEPGDTLADPSGRPDPGAQLGRLDADPVLRRPDQRAGQPDAAGALPERTWIYEYDSAAKTLGRSRPRAATSR